MPVDQRGERRKSSELLALVLGAVRAPIPSPNRIAPAVAHRADGVPEGDDWLHEIEVVGLRMMAHKRGREVYFVGVGGDDWTADLAGLAPRIADVRADEVIFDGCVVARDTTGLGEREALRSELAGVGSGLELVAFDMIYLEGWDLRAAALADRKSLLREVLQRGSAGVHYADHVVGNGPRCFETSRKLGVGGIVSKRVASRYSGDLSRDWRVIKCVRNGA